MTYCGSIWWRYGCPPRADIATLELEIPNNADGQPNWRLYRVNATMPTGQGGAAWALPPRATGANGRPSRQATGVICSAIVQQTAVTDG